MNSVPIETLATLTAGLGPDSRVGMKINKATVKPDTLLLAEILDSVNLLIWSLAGKGRRPESVAATLIQSEKPKSGIKGFKTGSDLLKEREKIVKRINSNEKKKGAQNAKESATEV